MRIPAQRWAASLAVMVVMAVPRVCLGGTEVEADTLTDSTVQAAVRAIVAELYRRRDPRHDWDPVPWNPDRDGQSSQVGGYTPLVILALLHAGESYQEPRLRESIDRLEDAKMSGTYAVAVRTHVWALLPEKFARRLVDDTRWIAESFRDDRGGWSYEQPSRSGRYDNSLAQYGALALWESAKRGLPVADRLWQRLERRFIENQFPDGGWNYRANQPVSGSMTAAGLTALFITQDLLHARDALDLDDRTRHPYELAIDRGLQWMDENFSAAGNPGKNTYFFYYLYGVERVGLASGYASFGGRDWFRAGAAAIINRLCIVDTGSGTVSMRSRSSRSDAIQVRRLAFALLFLSRGRVPLAINKLMIPGIAWNNRPRDVANLTDWISHETETELNWQIVSLDDEPESWLDGSVLYLASNERLPWPTAGADGDVLAEPLRKLRRYLDLGGLLLAVGEGRSPAFARSIEQAGSAMYPQLKWRALPRDHHAYSLLYSTRGKRPRLRGLSNGVRDLVILAPGMDLPAIFQARDTRAAAAWTTAAHVYLYASEMNRPRHRLDTHAGPDSSRTHAGRGRARTILRASYGGNWNPEPLALEVFAGSREDLDLSVITRPLAEIGDVDPPPDLVLVCGIERREFTAPQQRAIKAYVDAGGVILFETPGGRGDFARGAEEMATALFGTAVRRLVATRVITGDGLARSQDLSRINYRPYAQQVFAIHETTPRLRGLFIDGQPRVLFSREDISHALLDQPRWFVAGYSSSAARALLANILDHASKVRGN